MLIYAPDTELATRLDRLLWTWPATGFVPHCPPSDTLAGELERAVLSRLGPEVDRLIEERLGRTLNEVMGLALDSVRAELTVSVTQMVREAVAASVAHALALPETTNPK